MERPVFDDESRAPLLYQIRSSRGRCFTPETPTPTPVPCLDTDQDGQQPKGPHLVDIGKRYRRAELIESVVKPSEKIAQGFDTYAFITVDGQVLTGFVVSESAEDIQIRRDNGLPLTLIQEDIEDRAKQSTSMMPEGLVDNITPEQLADLLAYLESLRKPDAE